MKNVFQDDLENALLLWFQDARSQNFSINGPLLQTKADELARMCSDFKCSDGWLSGFKSRNNITYQTVHGQSSDVKKDVCTNFGRKLLGLFFTYLPKDIFKVGKTAIFFFINSCQTKHYILKRMLA